MDEIIYELSVYSQDSSLNIDLLHKNIEKFERYSTPSRLLVLLWVKLKNNRFKMRRVQMLAKSTQKRQLLMKFKVQFVSWSLI
jgi:hypothetical protein